MDQPIVELEPVQPGVHTYPGSCHCGAVRFEVDVDLLAGTSQCNCTFCTKHGHWGVMVKPDAVRLLSGELGPLGAPEWVRCETCGVTAFGRGDLPELGGPFASVNLRCLDGVDLDGVPVAYLDGRNDTWAVLSAGVHRSPFIEASRVDPAPSAEQ